MKKRINKGTILNTLFFILVLVIVFVPSAKAALLQGLMEIGLFNPGVEQKHSKSLPPFDAGDIRFSDGKGKVISLQDLKGKVVFLNFWATWCPPCLAEMPSINKLYEKYKDDKQVVFVLVDADGKLPKAQAYMDRKKFALPVYSLQTAVPDVLFSGALPTTIVFDKQGRISYKESGVANYASKKFAEFVEKLKIQQN
ncbi:MAG: TlpA family protein disulfide reductase [Pedobacter sp.]|nr:MAG: TlpA family protein disulfide reductase [Pedobacter sp.]